MGRRERAKWQLQHQALKSIHSAMASMLHEGLHADIRLESQSDVTLAHSSVLASMSPVLRVMLEQRKTGCAMGVEEVTTSTIKLEEIATTKALRAFLRILYVGEFESENITWEHALEILAASHRYELPAVKAICASTLASMLTNSNCLRVLEYADMYDVGLYRRCKKYVSKHFKLVVVTEAFEDLAIRKPTLLVDLIRSKAHCSASLGLSKLMEKVKHLFWYGFGLK